MCECALRYRLSGLQTSFAESLAISTKQPRSWSETREASQARGLLLPRLVNGGGAV